MAQNESRSEHVIVGTVCQLTIATLMVAMRLVSRRLVKQFTLDDMFAIASWMCLMGCGIAVATMTRYGLGKHQSTLSEATLLLYNRCFWVSIVMYSGALIFIKLTFLLHYLRLLRVSSMRKFTIGFIIFVAIWGTCQLLTAFFQCVPINTLWDPTVKGHCMKDPSTLWLVNGAFHAVSDFGILLLPLPDLWQLRLPPAQKFYLLFVFGLGFLSIVISVVRMQWLQHQTDMTWWNVTAALWSLAELTSALCCSCLPFFKPLALKVASIFPSLRFFKGSRSRRGEGDVESRSSEMGLQGSSKRDCKTQDSVEMNEPAEMTSIY